MSIEFATYAMSIPPNIEIRWLAKLAEYGYVGELHPGITLTQVDSLDEVWLKLSGFPMAKPRARPGVPLLVGFALAGFPRSWFEEQHRFGDLPTETRELACQFVFRTSAGRSRMSYVMQLMGAASLASITNGYLDNPNGDLLQGDAAIGFALDDIRRSGGTNDVGEWPFETWPPLDYETASDFPFPEPIEPLPGTGRRPWWKIWS